MTQFNISHWIFNYPRDIVINLPFLYTPVAWRYILIAKTLALKFYLHLLSFQLKLDSHVSLFYLSPGSPSGVSEKADFRNRNYNYSSASIHV